MKQYLYVFFVSLLTLFFCGCGSGSSSTSGNASINNSTPGGSTGSSPADTTTTTSSGADPANTSSGGTPTTTSPSVPPAPAVAVSINPSAASLLTGGAQQFTATVQNTSNTNVAWTVDGILNGSSSVGTIVGTGAAVAYTAPVTSGSHTVTVTSLADTSQFASATVSVALAPNTIPSSNHVVVVMEENQNFSQVFPAGSATNCPSAGMPYLCSLAALNGLATNFYSNQHGSLLAYLYDTSGSAWRSGPYDCTGSTCASIGAVTGDNIVRALAGAGKSWRGYFEDMPSPGYMGGDTANYVQHHNPFIWYSDVATSVTEQNNMYPITQLAQDVAANALPNFSYVIPNIANDADGTGSESSSALLLAADNWLQTNIGPLLSSPPFQANGDGILIVVFDEANVSGKSGDSTTDNSCSPTQSSGCGGRVALVMIGPNVIARSTTSNTYQFQDMLHTIIHLLGLTDYMNGSAKGSDIALLPGA